MSAFVHDIDHIDLLVNAFSFYDVRAYVADVTSPGHWRQVNPMANLDELRRLLIGENVKSVLHRYPEGIDALEMAQYADQIADYAYRSIKAPLPKPAALIKAAHSYRCQACQHAEWEASDAKAVIDALEASLIQAIPEYRDADTWCYVRPQVEVSALG